MFGGVVRALYEGYGRGPYGYQEGWYRPSNDTQCARLRPPSAAMAGVRKRPI